MSNQNHNVSWRAKILFQMDSKSRARLYRTLAMLLHNRVLLSDALAEMWGVYSDDGRKSNDARALFLADARREVDDGRSLSETFKRWVSVEEAALLSSAEKTGDWRGALNDAMRLVAAKQGIIGAIVGGLMYPFTLFATVAFTLYIIATELSPAIRAAVPGHEWGGVTGFMFWLSDATLHYGLWALAGAVVATIAVLLSLPRLTGNLRYRLERYPPWSLYRVMQGAPFMVGIAVMLRAKIKLMDALNLMIADASPYMHERIDAIRRGIARGANLGVSMAEAEFDFPDREAIRFIRMLASRDGFDDALLNYAEDWMDNAVARVQAVMRVFGILALFAVAGVIGMVSLSSFDIQNTIQSQAR